MTYSPSLGAWDFEALERLQAARIDYITDRLAADFKNKTSNVGTAILMLRNLAEELRERESVSVWRCARCGKLNESEATVLWDDDNERWFQVGDKYGSNKPKCHGCLANIYTHPELMGQMYRLEPIEAP